MILSPLPVQKFFDNNGRPLAGGLLFTYEAGSSTKTSTYSDSSGTLNTNPIVLDFRGECELWIDPAVVYKFVLSPRDDTDPPANPIWSVDNIESALTLDTLTQQIIGQILWPRTAQEVAASVTPENYAYESLLPERYGGIGDGSHPTQDAAAWTSWRQVAVQSNTTGSWWGPWSRTDPLSFALGYRALRSENVGTENTAIGYNVMPNAVNSIRNTAIGANSMPAATAAYQNTAVGVETLFSLTVGTRNCAFGTHAMYSTTNENESTAYGASALYSTNAAKNTAVGREAGYYITTGEGNVAVGYEALFGDLTSKATGFYNVALGYQSLLSATTAARNVAVGFQSLAIATTAYTNTCIGYGSGSAITTGQYNVVIGGSSGSSIATLSNRIIISDGVGTSRLEFNNNGVATFLNAITIPSTSYFIGNAANGYRFNNGADTLTRLTLSDAGILTLHAYGAGTLTTNGSGVVSATSDLRAKDVLGSFTRGLDAIRELKPILFRWKEGPMKDDITYAGFGAQDVLPHIPEAVHGFDETGYTFSDRPIIAALVNAVIELDAKVRSLQ